MGNNNRAMEHQINIAVVDDHTILRESLVSALEEEKDFHLIGHWSSGEELLNSPELSHLHVAILDNRLPGISGLETTLKIRQINRNIKSIILTMYCRELEILEALSSGASAYLPKENSINELICTIRSICQGSTVIGAGLISRIMQLHGRMIHMNDTPLLLTEDEKRILQSAASGLANKEIAQNLGISLGLVKFRFHEILRKLNARDRTHAVVKAFNKGLITLAQDNSIQADNHPRN